MALGKKSAQCVMCIPPQQPGFQSFGSDQSGLFLMSSFGDILRLTLNQAHSINAVPGRQHPISTIKSTPS